MSDPSFLSLRPAEREALKQEIFSSLHCALPGNVLSFDPDTRRAEIRPAVRYGSLALPPLSDVPVFMPVPFDIFPGDPCLVVFADVDVDAWLLSGEPSEPGSARKHSLSDGFAFVGWRCASVTDERSEGGTENATPVTGTRDWQAEGEDRAAVTITGRTGASSGGDP